MHKSGSKHQWLGLNEDKVDRRRFLKGSAAVVGTGIGTFGMVRDDWVFDFKGKSSAAAEGDDEPTLVPL